MNYNYESYDSILEGLLGGAVVFGLILAIFILALVIVGIIASWKLFQKAGKKGWQSIIPIYSYWVLIEIAGLNWWWFLLIISDSIVSILDIDELAIIANLVSLFASFNCYYNIAKKFNKETGYSVCAGIFSFIFVIILGFSKKEVYDVNIPVSKNGIFAQPESTTYSDTNSSYTGNVGTTNDMLQEVNQQSKELNENTNTTSAVSYCGNCGMKLSEDAKFCPNCGKEKL